LRDFALQIAKHACLGRNRMADDPCLHTLVQIPPRVRVPASARSNQT
jgi:hypothetical protein